MPEDLCGLEWKVFSENHFNSLCRDCAASRIVDENILNVCDRTREAAQVAEHKVSTSASLTKLGDKKPVWLCSHEETENCTGKAHLCPKLAKNGTQTLGHMLLLLFWECGPSLRRIEMPSSPTGPEQCDSSHWSQPFAFQLDILPPPRSLV